MQLTLTDLFYARWTEDIHDEWIRNLLSKRPDIKRNQLERIKELMNYHADNCLVVGYEPLIPTLNLPDPGDRHVLAAAIQANANIILTFNLKDFPISTLAEYGIEALHPDQFLLNLLDVSPIKITAAIEQCRQRLKNPSKSWPEYLVMLERQGLAKSANRLSELGDRKNC